MTPEIGTLAPDLTLLVRIGQPPVSLSSFRGKQPVVVAFFPLAFSGVCTKELCQFQEDLADWQSLNAEILGVSIDSPFVNSRFAQELGLSFPLLSDFNREAVTAWGVRNDDFFGMKGVSNRSVFVVDTEGRIAYSWVSEDAGVLPDFAAIRAVVEKLRQQPA